MLSLFIAIYLAMTLGVGWFASRFVKNSRDFALAGRQMPTYVVAAGLFATWFGSETIMGASSEFMQTGVLGIIEDPFGAALCLFLLGLFYTKPLYKLNLLTFSDYFSLRFTKRVELISAFFMIPSYFSWIAAQLIALAIVLESIMGLPISYGVVLCASIVLIYTYIGGMWSVSITDTIQTVIIIFGLVWIAWHLVDQVGGISELISSAPPDFLRLTPKEQSAHAWLLYFGAWITIGWGSIPQQDVFQRILSAKNEKTAVRGAYLSSFLYLTIAILPLLIVWCGSILYPSLKSGDPQMAIPKLILTHSTLPVQILFFGALLSAILSTCSGAILAPATVVAENIVKPLYGEKISDKTLLYIMRLSVVVITVISVGMSFVSTNIYTLVGEASALSLVALFVPLTAGIYWKKASEWGAILSMIGGTLVWVLFAFIFKNDLALIFGLLASILGMVGGSFWNLFRD